MVKGEGHAASVQGQWLIPTGRGVTAEPRETGHVRGWPPGDLLRLEVSKKLTAAFPQGTGLNPGRGTDEMTQEGIPRLTHCGGRSFPRGRAVSG